MRAEPALSGVQAIVDVETVGGEKFSVRCDHPLGAPENRLSRAQVETKFRTYARGRLSQARVEDVIGEVVRLEQLGSVRTLMDMLRATPQRAVAALARG